MDIDNWLKQYKRNKKQKPTAENIIKAIKKGEIDTQVKKNNGKVNKNNNKNLFETIKIIRQEQISEKKGRFEQSIIFFIAILAMIIILAILFILEK